MIWFYTAGILSLLINSVKDVRTKLVDDRWNYYCLGVSFTLMAYFKTKWYTALVLLLCVSLLYFSFKRWSNIGHGDISAFNWITIGGFVSSISFILYFWLIMGFMLVGLSIKDKIRKEETALYPFILVAFVLAIVLS